MDTLGVGFLLIAGSCVEHFLCLRDHGLCVRHVTSYVLYPVTPGEDTETRGEGVLGPKVMGGGDGTCCQSPAPIHSSGSLLGGRGASLCPGAMLPRGGPQRVLVQP